MNKEAEWIPLMDYAMKNGVSLSTLRRHIKSNKIPFKVEHGRYLLRANQSSAGLKDFAPTSSPVASKNSETSELSEINEIRLQLRHAQEEISELKMLVALYEEQLAPQVPPANVSPQPSRSGPMRFTNGF